MTYDSFLTLHILADGCVETDLQRAGRFLAATGARAYNLTACSRYNESEKIIRMLHAYAPLARPLWRGYPTQDLEDSGLWKRVTPQEWVNFRIAPNVRWLKEFNVVAVTCNEVGVFGKEAERYSNWEAGCAENSRKQFDVATGMLRLSTGNPLETEHDNYDSALEAAAEFDCILTPNEYTSTRKLITDKWHVGRFEWMWKQQDKLKVKRSQVVIGEYGIARVNPDNSLDPYNGYGAESVNVDQHTQVIRHDGETYREKGVIACWFVHGKWPEGKGSFDVHTNEPLLTAVEDEAKKGNLTVTTKPVTAPLNPPYSVTPLTQNTKYTISTPSGTAGSVVNLRNAPVVTSTSDIGDVSHGTTVTALEEMVAGAEYWVKIKMESGQEGWVSRQTNKVTFTPVPIEIPPPDPVPPPVVGLPPAFLEVTPEYAMKMHGAHGRIALIMRKQAAHMLSSNVTIDQKIANLLAEKQENILGAQDLESGAQMHLEIQDHWKWVAEQTGVNYLPVNQNVVSSASEPITDVLDTVKASGLALPV